VEKFTRQDELYMSRALKLAKQGNGYVNPNPLVGAVIVKDGEVVGKGYHRKFGGPHAEVRALEDAGNLAQGGKMYVTLEPCTHHGKTPPCTDAIIDNGLKEVFIATKDPNPKVSGGGEERLRKAGIKVHVGLLEQEAIRINEIFFRYVQTGIPFVLLKLAMTADGKLATTTGDSRWVTSEVSRKRVHELRSRYSSIMVGKNTLLEDDPRLTVRKVDGPDGARFILTTSGDIPTDLHVFNLSSSAQTIVVTGKGTTDTRVESFRNVGASVWKVKTKDGRIDLSDLLVRIGDNGYDSLLVEGGGELAWSFLSQGLVDKIHFFISPKIIGGVDAISAVGGAGMEKINEAIQLERVQISKSGPDVSYVGYPRSVEDTNY